MYSYKNFCTTLFAFLRKKIKKNFSTYQYRKKKFTVTPTDICREKTENTFLQGKKRDVP